MKVDTTKHEAIDIVVDLVISFRKCNVCVCVYVCVYMCVIYFCSDTKYSGVAKLSFDGCNYML